MFVQEAKSCWLAVRAAGRTASSEQKTEMQKTSDEDITLQKDGRSKGGESEMEENIVAI